MADDNIMGILQLQSNVWRPVSLLRLRKVIKYLETLFLIQDWIESTILHN